MVLTFYSALKEKDQRTAKVPYMSFYVLQEPKLSPKLGRNRGRSAVSLCLPPFFVSAKIQSTVKDQGKFLP